MAYSIKEMYYTLQGEGAQTGRPAVFCRFSGCNLWTGRERDRAKAICQFCDTDFVGIDGPNGGRFSEADELAAAVDALWPSHPDAAAPKLVVCTGGEPLLQLDSPAIKALQARGFMVAVETNGTQIAPSELDWICVSPKARADFIQRAGQELKLVFPQENLLPEMLPDVDFEHFYLQPMDGPNQAENTALAVEYCLANPRWKLSLQTHKYIGID